MEIFKPGGGYVFNNIHNIQGGVSPENIVAMYDTAYEAGFYRCPVAQRTGLGRTMDGRIMGERPVPTPPEGVTTEHTEDTEGERGGERRRFGQNVKSEDPC